MLLSHFRINLMFSLFTISSMLFATTLADLKVLYLDGLAVDLSQQILHLIGLSFDVTAVV